VWRPIHPPSSQDKISEITRTQTERDLGWDIGSTGALAKPRWRRPDYFHNDLSNGLVQRLFQTLNLEPQRRKVEAGAARATDCQSRAHGQLHISGSRKHFLERYTQLQGRVCHGGRATNFTLQFRSLVEKTAHSGRSKVRKRARRLKTWRTKFRHRRLQFW